MRSLPKKTDNTING